MLWFSAGRQLNPTLLLTLSLLHRRMGLKIRKVKLQKFVVGDKDSLISFVRKGNKPPEREKGNKCRGKKWYKRKQLLSTKPVSEEEQPLPTPTSIQFYCWAWCSMVCNNHLVSWSQLSHPCPPSLFTPSILSGTVGGAGRALALCKPCPARAKTSLHYQHSFQHKPQTQPHTNCKFCLSII